MPRMLSFVVLVVFVIVSAACGSSGPTLAPTPPPAPPVSSRHDGPTRVASAGRAPTRPDCTRCGRSGHARRELHSSNVTPGGRSCSARRRAVGGTRVAAAVASSRGWRQPARRPSPPPPPTSEEVARVYLAEFIRLGTQEVPRGRDGMARWIAHLDALVTTVEANPPVAEAFLKLLQQALTSRRSTLVQMEDLSPERFVAHLGPPGPLPSVRQQAAPASGQPQPAPTAGQSLWQRVVSTFVEFVKNTAFGVATAGTALQAADPEVARAALSSVARRDALQQCYDNFEACRAGQLPAYNRLAAGDVEGAFVLAHPQAVVTPTPPPAAAAPPSSSGSAPQAAGGQAPAASTGQTGSFTATPAPPPSAQESSAGPPAPSPAPPPAPPPEPPAAMVAVNMTGRWVGSYHEDLTMTVDGKSCSTSYGGRVTHVLVHSGTTLSGSAVFEGGAPELDPDTCIIKSRDDWEETLNNAPVGEVVVGRRFVIRTSDDAAGWSQTTTITLLSPNTAEVTYSGGTPFSRWSGTINIRRER